MRAILFAKISDKVTDLLSLITVSEDNLALPDEQIRDIEEKLVVHSLEELEHIFDLDYSRLDFVGTEKKEILENVAAYYHVLAQKAQGKEYQLWYFDEKEKEVTPQKDNLVSIKVYEIWLGVKSFFEQGTDLELLVTNLSYQDLHSTDAQRKLSLYMETVNEKSDRTQQITFAIFPEIPMLSEQEKITRIRFEGRQHEKEYEKIDYDALTFVLDILKREHVKCCYQYVTCEESSAKFFAASGRTKMQDNALRLQKQVNCDAITCCYPNLTWIEDQVYIGAAYIVVGMLLAGKTEKSATTMPRELYPYGKMVREEFIKSPFGAMLAYSDGADRKQMILFCARSQEWGKKEYVRIDRENSDV